MVTPLQNNFINSRQPQLPTPPTVDFTKLQKQFVDSAKATGDYLKSLAKLEISFGNIGKSATTTTKSVKAVDRSISVLGVTVKGTAKELVQVGTALGVVTGAFFDLQQRVGLVTAPLKGITEALQAVSDKAKGVEIAQAIGVDTTGIQKLELFRAGLFGNVEALEAFRTTSQTAGIAFSLNLTKLNTILKTSKEELRDIGQEARKLSKDLGGAASATDIIAGQYQIASAGFTKAADSRAVAEASGILSTVGFNDFFSTADLVTKSLRAYGLEASKAGEIAAKLNAIVEVGITTIPELAAGFGETAVVANAFGINIDQLGAAIATITTQGSSTPEALTGIEALFRTLANQSPQATKALSELTLNGQKVKFDIATVQAKGLGNALTDVFKAANGNVEVLREIIPESRALQAALALAAQGGSLFAKSLEEVSASSPTKLGDIFGEVQEDPTIKLKAITTKAEELVGSLAGNYEQFTGSAVNALAQFVSVTEVIASNPVVQALSNSFLAVAGTIGKVVGVFSALGGAAFSVISTLASINIFNNLFNGGLIKQGKLVKESALGLKDFGLVLQQITGVDTTKSIITGLSKQVDELKEKGATLRLANPQDSQAIEENDKKLQTLTQSLAQIRKEANKPTFIALKGIKEAQLEVQSLQAQLSALATDDPQRNELLNKQRDAIGRVGEERLKLEEELRKQEKAGTITPRNAERQRERGNESVKAVSGFANKDQALFDSVTQRTTISDIRQELEKERAKGASANQTRIANLAQSLEQVNKGTLGVIGSTGKLEQQYKQVTDRGRQVGITIARGWDIATKSFGRSRQELRGVEAALNAASRSENISNFGNATGKLFSSTASGLKLLAGGIKTAGLAAGRFGLDLIGNLLNPLSLGLAAIGLATTAFQEFAKGQEFQQEIAQKFAEVENKRGEAVRNTTKALEDQARVQKLVASGLSEKDARNQVDTEKKETELRSALPRLNGERGIRAQQQLASGDFRTADTFAKEEIGKLRDNKLGLGKEDTSSKTTAKNTGTLITTSAATATGGAIGIAIGAKFAAAGTLIAPGIGTLIGLAVGTVAGLAISEGLRKLEGNAQIAEVEAEFSARRRLELEKKFRLDEAKTPLERSKRQGKVDEGVKLDTSVFKASVVQNGLDNNVLQELTNSKDAFLLGQGNILKQLQSNIEENNKLLADADKAFKENKVPADLFTTDELTEKVNTLLAGKGSTTVEDLQKVDAEFKDKIEDLKRRKEIADRSFEEFKSKDDKGGAAFVKSKSDALAAQIEQFGQLEKKIQPKLKLANTQIQNAIRNGNGATASILLDESKSAATSIDNIKKALSDTATEADVNSLNNQLQSLGASLEVISDLDPDQATKTIKQVRDLLSGEAALKLNPQQIIGLQNIVAASTNKLAQEQVAKFESLARRTQALAAQDGVAGRAGQEQQNNAELQLLDAKIAAQKQIVADTQAIGAKERATNDLIQLQLEKKAKTIDARIQKEINGANLIFEREKARFDLQKAALDLTKSDLDLKKQIFEQFGLQTEGVDTDLAQNKLKQLQADSAKQRAEIAKERADLVRTQQAGLQQQAALLEAPQPALQTAKPVEEKKLNTKPFDDARAAIDKQESDFIKAANIRSDIAQTSITPERKQAATEGINSSYADIRKASQFTLDQIKKAEADNEQKITAIKKQATAERRKIALAEYNASEDLRTQQAREENKRTNKKNPNARKLEDGGVVVNVGNPQTNKIASQQNEELARLDARNKALDEQLKKQEQAIQFEIDLAEAYNSVVKPLERQSKLLQDSVGATQQVLAATQQLNPIYVSQEALQGSIQAGAGLQVLAAKRTLDVEKQKLDIQEKLLKKNGLLTADVKKQLDDQRTVLDNNFKQQVVQIQFEAKQASIDAFTKKLQAGIEQKLKALGIQQSGLSTFADSFEDGEDKDAVAAKKLAGAIAIDIAVQQASLAEQVLKTEQEKTLNQLKQNDLQLQFLDIQLKIQATQTKDKDLLDSIASARGSISGLRANIGAELKNAPDRFAKEQELQRKQSILSVSSASLQFTKEFDPKNLKAQQESFLQQNQLSLKQPVGDTSINNAVNALIQESDRNKKDFAAFQGQQRSSQSTQQSQPIRTERDGSITNTPPNYTINVNVGSSNATPDQIAKVVKQEMLSTTKELLRRK